MLRITIEERAFNPLFARYYAYWGEDIEFADYWGSGSTVEAAVNDLILNYDIPEYGK